MSNAKRRKVEDRLALLFMGIVALFLVCHFPRILLNFYEMVVIESAMECANQGKRAFDVWAMIMTSVSHFLLVFSSSINILFYSVFNAQFRTTAKRLLDQSGLWIRETFAKTRAVKRPNQGQTQAAVLTSACKREGSLRSQRSQCIEAAAVAPGGDPERRELMLVNDDHQVKIVVNNEANDDEKPVNKKFNAVQSTDV